MIDIKMAFQEGLNALRSLSPSAQIDTEILLASVMQTTRTVLYTHSERTLSSEQHQRFKALITARCQGIPIAYIIQSKEFWSLPLQVTPETLIPRPETELLVELTLALLNDVTAATVLDLGTGSGAIALALAAEKPYWQIHAYDCSHEALDVARNNAHHLHLEQIHFGHSNWFATIPALYFDAIISNPPYISETSPYLNNGDVRFEPRHALISGKEGLDDITTIMKDAQSFLKPGGFLLIEHGFDQKEAVLQLFKKNNYSRIRQWQDWQGNDRASIGFIPD